MTAIGPKDIMILLDNSASMKNPVIDGSSQTRYDLALEATKLVIETLTE